MSPVQKSASRIWEDKISEMSEVETGSIVFIIYLA